MIGAEKVKIFGEEIAVNARIEYIEGYSGHADQEWLLNFVYSFINPPKHIFLVHGEEDGQLELKQKIEENAKINVTIPTLGESYILDGTDNPKLETDEKEMLQYERLAKRFEILDNIETLMERMTDVELAVKEDKIETDDEDIKTLTNRVKELQEHINKMLS